MVRIVTDSTCDLSKELQAQWKLDVLHLEVRFGNERYRDGVDLQTGEFYEKLAAAKALPQTSQINPHEFAAVFQEAVDAGDEVVCIPISAHLSGTCQSALVAREMVNPRRIFVVDSRNATFGLALLVQQAVRLRDRGLSALEIAAAVEDLKGRVRFLAVVDTLKYLKLGGRISAATAAVGSILNIRPLISVVRGRVENVGRARGQAAAFDWIARRLREDPPDAALPVACGHSCAPQLLQTLMEQFRDFWRPEDCLVCVVGSTVGTHTGPGAVGRGYFAQSAAIL